MDVEYDGGVHYNVMRLCGAPLFDMLRLLEDKIVKRSLERAVDGFETEGDSSQIVYWSVGEVTDNHKKVKPTTPLLWRHTKNA